MVERMFVSDEKQSLEKLKEEARVAKELQLTPVWYWDAILFCQTVGHHLLFSHRPVKSEEEAASGSDAAAPSTPTPSTAPTVNGKREPSTDVKNPPPKVRFFFFFFLVTQPV